MIKQQERYFSKIKCINLNNSLGLGIFQLNEFIKLVMKTNLVCFKISKMAAKTKYKFISEMVSEVFAKD